MFTTSAMDHIRRKRMLRFVGLVLFAAGTLAADATKADEEVDRYGMIRTKPSTAYTTRFGVSILHILCSWC